MKGKALTPGYTNAEGDLHYHDDQGNLVIDFGGERESQGREYIRSSKSSTSLPSTNRDPGTGFPQHLVWTTKDGRRIPIPYLEDSHLLNIVAFLRRRVEPIYKRAVLADILRQVIKMSGSVYSKTPLHIFIGDAFDEPNIYLQELKDEAARIGRKVLRMSTDEFLSEYIPQFPYLLQEAYRRKLLIDSSPLESSNPSNPSNQKLPKDLGYVRQPTKSTKSNEDTDDFCE